LCLSIYNLNINKMKKLLLAVVLVVGIATFAQERNEQDGKEKGDKRERMSPEQRTQLQLKKLQLT